MSEHELGKLIDVSTGKYLIISNIVVYILNDFSSNYPTHPRSHFLTCSVKWRAVELESERKDEMKGIWRIFFSTLKITWWWSHCLIHSIYVSFIDLILVQMSLLHFRWVSSESREMKNFFWNRDIHPFNVPKSVSSTYHSRSWMLNVRA